MLLLALFIFGCRVLQVVRWILGIALLLALIVVVDRVLGWRSIVGDWQAVSAQALTAAVALGARMRRRSRKVLGRRCRRRFSRWRRVE